MAKPKHAHQNFEDTFFAARPAMSDMAVALSVRDRSTTACGSADPFDRALGALRRHLGMDVAFIAEFLGDARVFRYVNATAGAPISAGQSMSMDIGYCKKVVEGLLPGLIADTAKVSAALAIPETGAIPIGSHLSVPLMLADGRIYGTLCCFSFTADASLNERDFELLQDFAEIISYRLVGEAKLAQDRSLKIDRISQALEAREPSIAYQPIVRLADMAFVSSEALARFAMEPKRSPDLWFAEAEEVGLNIELERKAIRRALEGYRDIWRDGPHDLALNASPSMIIGGDLGAIFKGFPWERLIVEITEHQDIDDYERLMRALAPLKEKGVRIAVDDAGSGYASMRHILNIAPDYIKLDVSLTRAIDADRTRRALAAALIAFGHQTGARIVAEGVETAAAMDTLRDLGVHKAQGFHIGMPGPVAGIRRFARRAPKV